MANAAGGVVFDRVTKRYGKLTVVDEVSFTVAPGVGVVSVTCRFETVTLRVADPEPPAESVMVRPSAWLPLATVVVFQANDAVVALVVVEKT